MKYLSSRSARSAPAILYKAVAEPMAEPTNATTPAGASHVV